MKKLIILFFLFLSPEKECISIELYTDTFYSDTAAHFMIKPEI
jgi:hypothetical protein